MGDGAQLEACRIAGYVLKSHQTHPKERYRGMTFIVQDDPKGGLMIRGRRGDETHTFFEEGRLKRKAEKEAAGHGRGRSRAMVKDDVPLVTHVVGEVR
jgi:hypothetical protein